MTTKLDIPPNKTFAGDLHKIYSLLEKGENFAFSRFSDGEVYMLQNKEIIMSENKTKVNNIVLNSSHPEDDLKHFDPQKHSFYRDRLKDAITFRADNYYKGLSCRCCIGEKDFQWQLDLIGPRNEHNLSWSNLFINYNYLDFIDKFLPVFAKRKIVMVLNKNANTNDWDLPFQSIEIFNIGPYCIQNDYELIEEIKQYIKNDNISNHVFLCAASSLSNMIIHQCYSEYPNNTYIDIGSALNPFIPGIKSRRGYMNQFDTKVKSGKPCIW